MESLLSVLLRHPTWKISVRHDMGSNAYRIEFVWQSPSSHTLLRAHHHLSVKKLQQVRCADEWIEMELAKLEKELLDAIRKHIQEGGPDGS